MTCGKPRVKWQKRTKMYTVRQLITEAFRKSTVRGLTDTPESEEVETALQTLNTELDKLTARAEFSTSKRAVRASVGPLGYVTVSDNPARIIVSAITSGPNEVKINTLAEHGVSVVDHIDLSRNFYENFPSGAEYFKNLEVKSVDSPFIFTIRTRSGPIDGVKSGSFKLSSQGPEYDIDIIDCPPDNIYQVIDEDGWQLPELQEQDFYANRIHREFNWYFYEKSYNPYPRVWVGGKSTVTIVYAEPFWHDLKLDMDITAMPRSAQTTLKYMLAECLAEENGYTDIADRMHRKFSEAYADYCRSVTQSASPLPDFSAPGYFRTDRYNIENDGVGSGWRC
jgi:hypothetical protein